MPACFPLNYLLNCIRTLGRRGPGKNAGPELVIEIHGRVEGGICSYAGKVIITPTGLCMSNIKADSIDIAGEVHGDVEVKNLVIEPTGRLYGRAKYLNLMVQDGGILASDQEENLSPPSTKAGNRPLPPEQAEKQDVLRESKPETADTDGAVAVAKLGEPREPHFYSSY
ncbi:MAG TPA: polymer-forming cytoskeletal protein [Firmicutes bacterium]|nr:polymer-forming cytoskeletal protein [Bacillota bacterium]